MRFLPTHFKTVTNNLVKEVITLTNASVYLLYVLLIFIHKFYLFLKTILQVELVPTHTS